MAPVFGHGRLRLYLLKLLAEAPRHGYEVIRLLEIRFQGLYAPSAGTVYPRLAKLEAEGLVSHTEEGGRKVYSLTPAGHRELSAREGELTELEREIRDSLAALAAGIREDVSGSADDLRQEVRQAAQRAQAHSGPGAEPPGGQARGAGAPLGGKKAHRDRHAAHRAAKRAAEAAEEATRDRFEAAARRIQERVRSHASMGDWQGAVREGLGGLSEEFGGWSPSAECPPPSPGWADEDQESSSDSPRELERLLDRFRDDIRDAARDHGVTDDQLREARRHLSTAAAHIGVLLRPPG